MHRITRLTLSHRRSPDPLANSYRPAETRIRTIRSRRGAKTRTEPTREEKDSQEWVHEEIGRKQEKKYSKSGGTGRLDGDFLNKIA